MTFPQQTTTQQCTQGRDLRFKMALNKLHFVFSLLLVSCILPDLTNLGIIASPVTQSNSPDTFTVTSTANRLYHPPQSGIPDRREGAGTR